MVKRNCLLGYGMNATNRRYTDLVLPATAWLEDIGLKETSTHIYLMERALAPAGECRSLLTLLCELAQRLAMKNFFPWRDEEDYELPTSSPQVC